MLKVNEVSNREKEFFEPSGIAALNAEVTRQAAMVSYHDDFALMTMVVIAALPALLLIRSSRRQPVIAAADD